MPLPRDEFNALVLRYQNERMTSRQIDELVGLCKGSILDGAVSQCEAEYLRAWLEANRECAGTWPACALYPRIAEMLKDGILDSDEERELLDMLVKLAGGMPEQGVNAATALPLDNPAPDMVFRERRFCVTGVFTFGPRKRVQTVIEAAGGEMLPGVRKDLNYLVIGSIGTDSWKHSSFGTKILKAVDYKAQGVPIAIVSEAHWAACIK